MPARAIGGSVFAFGSLWCLVLAVADGVWVLTFAGESSPFRVVAASRWVPRRHDGAGEGNDGTGDFLGVEMYWSSWGTETNIGLVRDAGFQVLSAAEETENED